MHDALMYAPRSAFRRFAGRRPPDQVSLWKEQATMDMKRRWGPLVLGFAMVTAPAGVVAQSESDAPADSVKLGFVTKFPVDFFFTLENAAKAWDEAHPEAEVLFAQGQSATDDAGQIAAIEDLVAQGVAGIAVTPTSDAVI